MLHHTPSPFLSPETHTESGDYPQMVFLWLGKGELVAGVGFGEEAHTLNSPAEESLPLSGAILVRTLD